MTATRKRARDIQPGEVIVGWDVAGKRELVNELIDAPAKGMAGFGIRQGSGQSGLFIPLDATVTVDAPTTLEYWAGRRAGNYSSLPTIDVEILPDVYTCGREGCSAPELKYRKAGWVTGADGAERYDGGGFEHVAGDLDHEPSVMARCRFCRGTGALTSSMHAWHDETRCDRCGGRSGYAIGD